MAEQIRENSNNKKDEDITFKVEEFAQKCLSQRGLKIINFVETKLVPPVENCCSLTFKVSMSVCKSGKDKKEALALIAKTGLKTESSFIDWQNSFDKELFVYTDLIPTYQKIEREAGIKEEELIDVLPRHFSVDKQIERPTDDNMILLMENLKFNNFYTINRNVGMNMDHAEMALSLLARYHALGVAMRQKLPLLTARAAKHAKLRFIRDFIFDETLVDLCETFHNCARLAKYESTLKSSLISYNQALYSETYVPDEPWVSITHGDFWTNKILFHRQDNGVVDGVKFIDFQLYIYGSPLMDLPYFICTSLRENVLEHKVEELLNTYYNTFIYTLKSVHCDDRPYTRQSFNYELKKQANVVFAMCAVAIKFFTFDDKKVRNHEGFHEIITKYKTTDAFLDGLIKLVDIYEKQNWF